MAIVQALRHGISDAGGDPAILGILEDTSRQSANELMTAAGLVDLLIPRGGAGLIRACVENATVPCIETGTGICHVFVDSAADLEKAVKIIVNAKTSRPSVCNAEEVCLVHRDVAAAFLPMLRKALVDDRTAQGLVPVELRLDPAAAAIIPGVPAGEKDFDTEFLDYILAVRVVDSLDEAIRHIQRHSTGHSEAILTEDAAHAQRFTREIDSTAVYVNVSTRFTDGGEFGLGCEMGISTQKLHARGPMGLDALSTWKYIITGDGQIGTNSTFLILPATSGGRGRRMRGQAGLVRSVAPPFPTRIASLDSRGSPAPLQSPLKRPRRGLRPPSLDFPRFPHTNRLVCAEIIFGFIKRDADAYWIDRRGSRNTLRLFRMYLAWKSVCARYA